MDFARPLRARRKRPCDRATEQRDEVAPFPMTEMHPIPSRAGSTSQAYRIAPDQSAGMQGEPQGGRRTRPAGWESSLRELPAPMVLLFSLGHQPVAICWSASRGKAQAQVA